MYMHIFKQNICVFNHVFQKYSQRLFVDCDQIRRGCFRIQSQSSLNKLASLFPPLSARRRIRVRNKVIVAYMRGAKDSTDSIIRARVHVIKAGDESFSKENSVECIIQRINRPRVFPSRVYQRCEPKNRDSLACATLGTKCVKLRKGSRVSPSLFYNKSPWSCPSVCSVLPSRHSLFSPTRSHTAILSFSFSVTQH